MKPIIGITSSYVKTNEQSEGVYVHHDYHRAIEACGAIPLILPTVKPDLFMEMIGLCDGVILSGGEDVTPQLYGEKPHPKLGRTSYERDRMEIEGIRQLIDQDIPLLAICRGMQVLNVALGGTLIQDIPSQDSQIIRHRQSDPRPHVTHAVAIGEDSILFRILGKNQLMVNSLHHQAVDRIAPSLTVSGKAPDGIIEAVEDPSKRFVIGVQWHPESMYPHDINAQTLFQTFVRHAKEAKSYKNHI